MKSFFKITFASMLGTFLSLIILFFIFLGIIGSIASMAEKEDVSIKDNSILHIKIDKAILEREPKNPFLNFGFGENSESLQGLDMIKKSLQNAKTDAKIKGISLSFDMFATAGLATLQDLRKSLLDFKSSGKFIYTYGEVFTQKAYYVASVSDSIFLNPAGTIEFTGLNAETMFFKNALDKFKVDVQVIRGPDNKFKSAVEPFMLDKMSESNKEQLSKFMNSVWTTIVTEIAAARNIEPSILNNIADSLYSFDPEKALASKMVDKLVYQDGYDLALMNRLKLKKIDELEQIEIADYSTTLPSSDIGKKNKIAVIYAVGEIQSGKGDDETIGSDRISEAIRKAKDDSAVKAIVLRVNSPGGSALASEVMWRELILAKQVKPVVVSMGDYAASGGYYISCMADKIVAQPNTLTGSIGVFGMLPNFKQFMESYIGITFDRVGTNANSDLESVFKPLSPFQFTVIQKEVGRIYSTFLQHVADGRKMSVEDVDKIGQGRIWSGTDAKNLGLVDEIGYLEDAVKIAASLAKVKDYRISNLPEQIDVIEQMFGKLKGNKSLVDLKSELGESYKYLEYFNKMKKLEGIQARLPFFVDFQ